MLRKVRIDLTPLGEENQGFQMLVSMGWAGGALPCSTGEGLAEPVAVEVHRNWWAGGA